MDISQVNSAIKQLGFSFGSLTSTNNDSDIQKFAQENNISVNEAKSVLQQAEKKAAEEEKYMEQQTAFMQDLLNSQDEEEIVEIEDMDFDNFLQNDNPEDKMQQLMNQQQFKQNNNSQNNNFFSGENPFLKLTR